MSILLKIELLLNLSIISNNSTGKKTRLPKLGCHGIVNVDAHVTTTLKIMFPDNRRELAKFGGHSLNGFEVIQLFRDRDCGLLKVNGFLANLYNRINWS